MANQLNNFEESIKNSLENHEVPYNQEHWDEMEKNLDKMSEGAVAGYSIGWSVLSGIAVLGILAGVYFYYPNSIDKTENVTNDLVSDTAKLNDEKADKTKNNLPINTFESETNKVDVLENTIEKKIENIPHKNKSKNKIKVPSNNEDSKVSSKKNSKIEEIPAVRDLTKFSINSRKGCEGLLIQFKLDNPDPKANYLWNFGDGYFSNESNPSHAFNKSGVFDVSISVTSSTNGNISSNTIADMVEIEATPDADFDIIKTEKNPEIIKFTNNSQEAQKYEWDFGDGKNSTELNPIHFYKEKGEFIVKLLVTNKSGCTDVTTKKVLIENDYNLLAPNLLVPSENEFFMPKALLETNNYKSFLLQVYDATNGNVIFESKKSTLPWNGKLPSGEFVKAGKYPWFVSQIQNDGKTEIYKGIVEIKQ